MNNPLDAIQELIKEFCKANAGKEPTKLLLPQSIAFDILKLGRNEIGDLADDLQKHGIKAINKLFGLDVTITHEEGMRIE
jgi:hypothetical protein